MGGILKDPEETVLAEEDRHSMQMEGHQQRQRWKRTGRLGRGAGGRGRNEDENEEETADDCRWSPAEQRFYFSFCRHDGKIPVGVEEGLMEGSPAPGHPGRLHLHLKSHTFLCSLP